MKLSHLIYGLLCVGMRSTESFSPYPIPSGGQPLFRRISNQENIPQHLFALQSSSPEVDQGKVSDKALEASSTSSSPHQSSSVRLDMPWNQLQEWALHDNVGKYTITAPIMTVEGVEKLQSFILWRTLTHDVTELSGYPFSFLIQRYQEMQNQEETGHQKVGQSAPISLEILPFLDDFIFEANGGLSGRIYGIRGVKEGTRIQTTPVTAVESTLPKNFVRTLDGQIIYELGCPSSASDSVDSTKQMADRVAQSMQQTATKASNNIVQTAQMEQGTNKNDSVLDSDLINLAGATGVTMVAALAMQSLAHHLTVNVFWV